MRNAIASNMPHAGPRTPGPVEAVREQQWTRDYFVYGVIPVTINAGATAQASVQIQANSYFLWERAAYFADIALAAVTDSTRVIPLVTVQIVDSGSGRQLFNQPQPIASIFGSGELPFLLPQPRYFEPNSLVQFQFANFSAATNYNIRLSLIGAKYFEGKPG